LQGVLAHAKNGEELFWEAKNGEELFWEEKFHAQPMGRPKRALKVPFFSSF
jgi:hypothetical protein